MQRTQPTSTQPMLWTIAQTAKELQLSRTKVYQLILKEGLPVVHIGRKKLIIPDSLQQWLKAREME